MNLSGMTYIRRAWAISMGRHDLRLHSAMRSTLILYPIGNQDCLTYGTYLLSLNKVLDNARIQPCIQGLGRYIYFLKSIDLTPLCTLFPG